MENNMKKSVEAINVLSNAKAEQLHSLTKTAAWDYYCAYMQALIDPVGVVTVAFWPFQALVYAVRSYIDVQGWEESEAKKAKLKDLAALLDTLFQWLKNELLVGTETTKQSKEYVSPVCVHGSEDGPEIHALCMRTARKTVRRARRMEFSPLTKEKMAASHEIGKEEMRTLQNVLMFCDDMQKVGRMSQEMTIDATKQAEPPRILKLIVKGEHLGKTFVVDGDDEKKSTTLLTALRKVKLLSRQGQLGLKFDFDAKALNTKVNPKVSRVERKNGHVVYKVYDMLEELRQTALLNAITVEMTEKLTGFRQELPPEEVLACKAAVGNKHDIATAVRFMMQLFRDIQDGQKAILAKCRELDKDMQSANEKAVRTSTKKTFIALSSMAEAILMKGGVPEDVVRLVLGVTMEYLSKDATRPSSFVGIIMEERFMQYIMSLYAQDYPELTLTRDELAYCDAEDGEEVEFVGGIVPGRAIFSREKNAIPDGKYTVRKNGKSAYVEASVRERLDARIAEKYEPNTLLLETIPVANQEIADAIVRKIRGGKEVTLIRQDNTLPTGYQYNVINVDGEAVACYQAKVKRMVRNEQGELVTTKKNGHDDYAVCNTMNAFYGNKRGTVSFAQVLSIPNSPKRIVMVVLKDTQRVFVKPGNTKVGELLNMQMNQQTQAVANAKAHLGSLASMGADVGETVQPKKVEKPSMQDILAKYKKAAAPVEKEAASEEPAMVTPGKLSLSGLAALGAE